MSSRLLLVVFALVVSSSQLLVACTAESTDLFKVSGTSVSQYARISQGRSLRAARIDQDEDGDGDNSDDVGTEDRKYSHIWKALAKNMLCAKCLAVADDPLSTQIVRWAEEGKSVDEVKSLLGLSTLSESAIKLATNYKYYDEYVTGQVELWVKSDLSPLKVMEKLGIGHLAGEKLTGNINFQYYGKFMETQIPNWVKQDKSVDEVKSLLGLSKLSESAIRLATNYKYYDEYVTSQVQLWVKSDLSPLKVMKKLGLGHLAGEKLTGNINFQYYGKFVEAQIPNWVKQDLSPEAIKALLGLDSMSKLNIMYKINEDYFAAAMTSKLEFWATERLTTTEVQAKLGMENLKGYSLTSHANYRWLQEYSTKQEQYLMNGWMNLGLSTGDVWTKLGLTAHGQTLNKGTGDYALYVRYVNTVDDKIAAAMEKGGDTSRFVTKNAAEDEMLLRTQIWIVEKRDTDFVKMALGLNGLPENELKASSNYKFLEKFVALSVRKVEE